MKELERDLERFERGELSLDALERAHPGEDVRGLAALSERLLALGAEPTPDPEASWSALRERLPERTDRVVVPFRKRRVVRRATVALVAAVLSTTVAYAAGFGPVRQGVDTLLDGVTKIFRDDPALPGPGTPTPGPSVSTDDHPSGGGEGGDTSGPGGGGDDGTDGGNDDSSGPGGGDDDGSDDGKDDNSGSGGGDDSGSDGSDDSSDSGGGEDSGSGGGDDGADDHSGSGGGDDAPDEPDEPELPETPEPPEAD